MSLHLLTGFSPSETTKVQSCLTSFPKTGEGWQKVTVHLEEGRRVSIERTPDGRILVRPNKKIQAYIADCSDPNHPLNCFSKKIILAECNGHLIVYAKASPNKKALLAQSEPMRAIAHNEFVYLEKFCKDAPPEQPTVKVIECFKYTLGNRWHYAYLMEYYPTGNLVNYIIKENPSIMQRLHFASGVIDSLLFLKPRQLVHRDLKCDNFLLDSNLTPRLTDFGFCTNVNDKLAFTKCKGTLHFTPSECFKFRDVPGTPPEDITLAIDVFSLGGIILEIFSNFSPPWKNSIYPRSLPFLATAHLNFRNHLKRETTSKICQFMADLFNPNPHRRPSIEQIRQDFSRLMDEVKDKTDEEVYDVLGIKGLSSRVISDFLNFLPNLSEDEIERVNDFLKTAQNNETLALTETKHAALIVTPKLKKILILRPPLEQKNSTATYIGEHVQYQLVTLKETITSDEKAIALAKNEQLFVNFFSSPSSLVVPSLESYCYSSDEKMHFVNIFPYYPKGKLQDLITGPLQIAEKFDLIEQCINSVDYLHKLGIVHGSICPENFVADTTLRLTHLENCTITEGQPLEEMCTLVRQDIFSLGVTIYSIITGKPAPWHKETDLETIARIKQELFTKLVDSSNPLCNYLATVVNPDIHQPHPLCPPIKDFMRQYRQGPILNLEALSTLFDA